MRKIVKILDAFAQFTQLLVNIIIIGGVVTIMFKFNDIETYLNIKIIRMLTSTPIVQYIDETNKTHNQDLKLFPQPTKEVPRINDLSLKIKYLDKTENIEIVKSKGIWVLDSKSLKNHFDKLGLFQELGKKDVYCIIRLETGLGKLTNGEQLYVLTVNITGKYTYDIKDLNYYIK